MGSFGGHALPGSFFIVFGIWWTFQIFNRYFTCKRKNIKFTATPTFPCSCLCGRFGRWPIEPCVKIFFTAVGGSIEVITGYDFKERVFNTLGNGQHATMFFFYGLTGVMDILVHFKTNVPEDVDYVSFALAIAIEGLLFNFHLHGRAPLNTLVHVLLIYTIFANFIAVIVEMRYRHNVLAPLMRTYFLFLQGMWFWQVAFILFNPSPNAIPWDPEDHEQMMVATMIFAWHCGIVFLVMLGIGGFVGWWHSRCGGADTRGYFKKLSNHKTNGDAAILAMDDCESDNDFEAPLNES